MAFVAEEARDLRMYGFDRPHSPHYEGQHQHQHQYQYPQRHQHSHDTTQPYHPDSDGGLNSDVLGVGTTEVLGTGAFPTILPDGTDLRALLDRLRAEEAKEVERGVESSLGRVVFGGTGWGRWTDIPA